MLVVAGLTVLALGSVACSGSDTQTGSSGRPTVVVTYSVLGAVVKDVVGGAAHVIVLMPNGANPHEWSPSAKNVEAITKADLVIDNGLGLEGNLQDPLNEAKRKGVRVFTVADHVTIRKVKAGEGAEPDDPDQAPGADDPHLWMDPLTIKQWIGPLATELKTVGIDATANAARVTSELDALNAQVVSIVDAIPQDRRKLVTGHESMGYFAERYGFQLIGAVVPAITSQAEASAGALAALTAKIRSAAVPAIFAEIGTPAATVKAIAGDSGVKVVELEFYQNFSCY